MTARVSVSASNPYRVTVTAAQRGATGPAFAELEFQSSPTHLQYRIVGEDAWADMVALADITGPAGADGALVEMSTNETHLLWRYVGDESWTELIALSLIFAGHELTYDHSLIGTAVQGDDARLTDARAPLAHAGTHATLGDDPLTPQDIGAADALHDHAGAYEPAGAVAELVEDVGLFGFLPGTAQTAISFDPDTYQVTLAPSGGTDWTYYRSGARITITGSKTATLAGDPPVAGKYYVYIDSDTGALVISDQAWTLADTKVPVAFLEYRPTLVPKYLLYDERHPADISRGEHARLHLTTGALYKTGGDISGQTYDQHDDDGDIRFSVAAGAIYDETLLLSQSALTAGVSNFLIRYRDGAGGWTWAQSPVPFVEGPGGTYIGVDDGDGTLTNASSGNFLNVWMLMTAAGYQFLMPQNQYGSEAAADREEFQDLTLTGLPIAEFVARARICYEAKSNYSAVTGAVELKSIIPINIGAIPAASGSYDAAGTAAAAIALHEATYAHADIATAMQPDDDAADLGSGVATDGYVLTADGEGGAAWEEVAAGSATLAALTDVDVAGVTDGQVLTYNGTSEQWEPSTPAAGGSLVREHAWADPYSYCGVAPAGSATSAEVWTITRLTISAAGAVTATATASDVAWDDYATATYS